MRTGGAHLQYRPAAGDGAWWIAAEGTALAVLAPVVTERTADAVWRRLGDGGIGAVLDALTGAFGTSLTAIPPFALAVAEPTGVRVAVRGAIEVIVDAPEGVQAITGAGTATWVERFVTGATRVTVSGGAAAEQAAVPLRSGVVLADLVVATLGVPARTAPVEPVAVAAAAPAVAPIAEPESAATPEPAPVAEPTAVAAPEPEPAAADAAEPALEQAPAPEPVASIFDDLRDQSTSADTWMPADTSAAPVDEYDLLWGETVARPISAAAVVVPEEAAAGAAAGDPAPEASAAPVSPAAAVQGDHDGETVSVAHVRAMRAAEREQYESTDDVPARRPARGRIVLSTGRVVELERPVIIGRRPKSTRTSGSELPTLVAVDSPEQDISRSHVEIRAEGEHVLVTDLDTTNGTLLLRGGQDPVRLHPGEPTMVVTGDILDLGDDITVVFEDLA